MNIHKEIRERMYAELRRTNLTQCELSKRSGIPPATISHLVCGERVGRIQTWQVLFDTLERIPSAVRP